MSLNILIAASVHVCIADLILLLVEYSAKVNNINAPTYLVETYEVNYAGSAHYI